VSKKLGITSFFGNPVLVASVIGILVFSLLLRWNSFTMPFERDEGFYAYSAWLLKHGGTLYKDLFEHKPPLIIYTYWVGELINEDALWPPRLLAMLFALATTFLVGIIAAKEFGKSIGFISMWLLPPLLVAPYFTGQAANTEVFMLLPLTGTLALYVFGREKKSLRYWFLAGVTTTLAMFYKPICLGIILIIFCLWIHELWRQTQSSKEVCRRVFVSLLGVLTTSFLIMLPIIVSGAWEKFVESAIIYYVDYLQQPGFGVGNFFPLMRRFLSYNFVLLIPLAGFFVETTKRKLFYLVLFIIGIIQVAVSPMGHYYLLVMPFLAIIAAVGLVNLSLKFRKIPLALLTIAMLIVQVLPIASQFGMTPVGLSVWIYGKVEPFTEAVIVGQKLAAITKENDKVFVAGNEAEILFYAKRKSVTRFVNTYALNIPSRKRLDFQVEAASELKNNLPAAIVISQRSGSGLWNENGPTVFIDNMKSLLKREYELVGGYIWDDTGDGYWFDKIGKEDIPAASLLLYSHVKSK
jgi:4-amino-4-deoxy-L-arabinose transferase-like glycosyltransferase